MNTPSEVRRVQEIATLAESFKRSEWCAILAPPLSGKSTLARQVQREFSTRFPNWRVESVELKPLGTLTDLWDHIQTQAKLHHDTNRTKSKSNHVLLAEELANAAKASPKPIALIIDNLDSLPDQVLRLFAAELRRLKNEIDFQSARQRLHLILLGELKLHELTSPHSPLDTIIRIVRMGDLNSDQSADLLSRSLGVSDLDGCTATALFEETNGHPHLVVGLGDRLRQQHMAPSEETIRTVAEDWIAESMSVADPDSNCFARIVEYLEHDHDSFDVVTSMLDEPANAPSKPNGLRYLMCGAVSMTQDRLIFRGNMIRESLARYFDPLRRADYAALHGRWQTAAEKYRLIPAQDIRDRRLQGTALFRRRIMDLLWNVSPYSMRHRSMSQAVDFVIESGHHFFGADQVLLWQQSKKSEPTHIVGRFPAVNGEHNNIPDHDHHDLLDVAIRRNETLTLLNNQGVICGIGEATATSRWALELRFEHGLPDGEWFRDGLHNLEPLVFMILDRARQREADQARLDAQRTLIHEIALKILPARSAEEVFQLIIDGVKDRLGYECAQLCLVFPDEQKLRGVKTNGVFDRIQSLTVRDLNSDDPLAVVVRTRETRIVDDCDDETQKCDRDAASKAGVKSFVAVPMIDEGQVVGVVQVGNTQRTKAFTPADADVLQLLADDAAVAIRLARARERTSKILDASGTAMAFVSTQGRIDYCNDLYREFFQVEPQQPTPLQTEQDPKEPLVRLAFQRNKSVTTVRERENRNYLVTAIATQDSFGRYAGGIEVVGTRNPVLGLSESLREMFTLAERRKLEQAIVNCLVQRLGYSRARLYKADRPDLLVSSCSSGHSPEATDWFASGKGTLQRDSAKSIGDGFECLRHDRPLIFVNQSLNTDSPYLPLGQLREDAQHRPVVAVDLTQIPYTHELEKDDLQEWVDVPLGTLSQPLGKLSVDLKDSVRQLGIEDLEILALFGRWASDALNRVITLERVQDQAKYIRDARVAGDRRGLEAMAWDFLLNVTLEGGPGFNRAALFLKSPRSGLIEGFLCHGAADDNKWKAALEQLPSVINDRRQFLTEARAKQLAANDQPEEHERIRVLREMVIQESDTHFDFAAVIREKAPRKLQTSSADLQRLYDQLQWQPANEALVCPLLQDGECEGLVYVDRVFSKTSITDDDAESLESLGSNLAMIVRPLQLAEQLRSQILAVSHSTISPAAAIRGLAEGLKPKLTDPKQRQLLDLITAEAQRSADLFRRLLRAAAGDAFGFAPQIKLSNVASILRQRLRPYQLLLEGEAIRVDIEAPESLNAEVDPILIGDVFAELAANARTAILRPNDPEAPQHTEESHPVETFATPQRRQLRIQAEIQESSTRCRITFENTGPAIALESQSKIWDRFVSSSGGTGIGLWFVKEIVSLHRGSISYRSTPEGLSVFSLELPLHQETQS